MNTADDAAVLRDLWYLACPARDLKRGRLLRREIAGEPIVLARSSDGTAFALRDICPHRGIPLSHGRLCAPGDTVDTETLEETQVECCYHGWRFGVDGHCRAIPSLVKDHAVDIDKIRTRSFPVVERQGLVWVYISARQGDEPDRSHSPSLPDLSIIPEVPGIGDRPPGIIIQQIFETDQDQAVIGLIDPAHGPYVHRAWWWRTGASMHDKTKRFRPAPRGFVMTAHAPSKNSFFYKLLGGEITTEISFTLPGTRTELISSPRGVICGVTIVTPVAEDRCEVTQLFYWTMPWAGALAPLVRYLGHYFLRQDQRVMALQRQGLQYAPRMMLIHDADVMVNWYYRLKRAWRASRETGEPFNNPVDEDVVLRWRT